MSGLPVGWLPISLGEVGALFCGQSPSASDVNVRGEGTLYVTGPEQWDGSQIHHSKWTTDPRRVVPDDCIFITVKGAGVGTLFPGTACAIGRDVYAYLPHPEMDRAFALKALARNINEVVAQARGTIPGLSKDHILDQLVGFPPLAEQRRIVAKLDALTARTARVRADLDRIPSLAARYKQAVLAKAFSGELTEPTTIRPTISVGDVIERVIGGKNLRCEERPPRPDELGVVKVSAVSWGAFNPAASKTLPGDFSPPEHTRISSGDFLISRANTLELVGAVVVVEQAPDNLFLSDKVLRLEMPEERKRWTMWFLRSPEGRAAIEAGSSGNQLSMRNLSQDALKRIQMPWPDDDARRQVVERIEGAFAKIDRLVAEAAAARRLVDRLDQGVLAKAFRGELVPQDPAEEPASVLLERIRAERAAAPNTKRGRPGRPGKNEVEAA